MYSYKSRKEEKKENAPALYGLTSLQRDSNRILGFTAQNMIIPKAFKKSSPIPVLTADFNGRYGRNDTGFIAEIESFSKRGW